MLFYYKDETETANNCKGFVQTGPGTEAMAMAQTGDGRYPPKPTVAVCFTLILPSTKIPYYWRAAVAGANFEFIVSSSNSTSAEGEGESKKSFLFRAANESERQDWLTIVKATCVSVGGASSSGSDGGAAALTAAQPAPPAAEEGVPPSSVQPAPEPAPAPAPADDAYDF